MISFEQYRDVTILHMGNGQRLVISCDSVGGVGEKPEDRVKAPPEIVGYYGARVAMMEMLSLKAKPLVLINTLSVEMEGYGERILEGIRKAVSELPDDLAMPITGSSEENFPMVQTALGVTVIGELGKGIPLPSKSGHPLLEDHVLCLAGLPKAGEEVLSDRGDILSMEDLYRLMQHPHVRDLLPVGSGGISHEVSVLEEIYGEISLSVPTGVDPDQSGGPSTSVLAIVKEKAVEDLKEIISAPVSILSYGRVNTGEK